MLMKRTFHDILGITNGEQRRRDEKRMRIEEYLGSKRYIELQEDPSSIFLPHKMPRYYDEPSPNKSLVTEKLASTLSIDGAVNIKWSTGGLQELLTRDDQRLFDATRPNPEGMELVLYTEPLFPISQVDDNQQSEYNEEDAESSEMLM